MNQAVAKKLDEIIGALQTTSQAGECEDTLSASCAPTTSGLRRPPLVPSHRLINFLPPHPSCPEGVASPSFTATAHEATTASQAALRARRTAGCPLQSSLDS